MNLNDLMKAIPASDPARTLELFHKLDEVCTGYNNLEILETLAALLRSMVYEAGQREPLMYPECRKAVVAACHAMADYVADMPARHEDLAAWLAQKEAAAPTAPEAPDGAN